MVQRAGVGSKQNRVPIARQRCAGRGTLVYHPLRLPLASLVVKWDRIRFDGPSLRSYNRGMSAIRRGIPYLVLLLLTIACGLLSRAHPVGWYWWDKSLGDALYAAAAYFLLRLLLPARPALLAAVLSLVWCYGVEAFKLTGQPAAWSSSRVSRLILGTTPSWHNIVCYTLAIAIVAAADACITRRTGEGRP